MLLTAASNRMFWCETSRSRSSIAATRLLLAGDVLVGGDPAAVRRQLVLDRDQAAIAELDEHGARGLAVAGRPVPGIEALDPLDRADAVRGAIVDDRLVRCSGPQHFGRQAVERGIAGIGNHQPLVAVEHHQALAHVVDRSGKAHVLQRHLGFAAPRRLEALHVFGDVLVQRDEAAADASATG